jgi:nickel/cobalt exporter
MIEPLADLGLGATVGIGYLLTAGLLGIIHGIEPDHVAGITALTHEAGDPKLSALVGGCFAAGHALLVVVWIAGGYLLFGTTSFPAVFEQLGTLFVGVVLALLSLYLGVTGTRKLIHRHRHDHGEKLHSHYHIHLPASIRPSGADHGEHSHDHGVVEYLKIGTVGALFTLSPPISMIAFISVTVADSGSTLMLGVVAAYAVSIIATMAVIGGGAGSVFQFSKAKGERFHAISQVVASVIVLGFAANVFVGLLG